MSDSKGYAFEDYRDDMSPRVFGSETEYNTDTDIESVFQWDYNSGKLNEDMLRFADPTYLSSHISDSFGGADLIMTTGGDLYYDVSSLEYATPECLTPEELALHERAGEQLVTDYVARMVKELGQAARVSKRSGFAVVEKNGEVLMEENSVGHHENYTSRSVLSVIKFTHDPYDSGEQTRVLNSYPEARGLSDYLALRKLIDGAGMVGEDGYSITQKPTAINYRHFTSSITHGNKRPFQYKDGDRLEIRTGEGNKSDFVVRLKYGLTSLVVRLIEHRAYPKHLLLENPTIAVEALSRDPHADVLLENGLVLKGMDVLKGIVDAAVDLNQRFPDAPKYELQAAEDFYTFYEDLKNVSLQDEDVSALSDRIDWAARYEYLLEQGGRYKNLSTQSLRMVRDDLRWDMLGSPDSARQRYRKFGHTAMSVEIPNPPKSRARARTKLARRLYLAGELESVQWKKLMASYGREYHFSDPFSPKSKLVYGKTRPGHK